MQYRRIVIALDFDRTYTAHRELWNLLIAGAAAWGHTVYCVTARSDKPENHAVFRRTFGPMYQMLAGVICTGHRPKRAFMEELGILVDVWIDDAPETVGNTVIDVITALRERFPPNEHISLHDHDGELIDLYPPPIGAA